MLDRIRYNKASWSDVAWVVELTPYNHRYRDTVPVIHKRNVTKVGRKYVYVQNERYDILTGREFLDGNSSYSYLFPTREEAENATNEMIVERKLAKYLSGNGRIITEEWPLEQKKSLLKMFEPEVNTE